MKRFPQTSVIVLLASITTIALTWGVTYYWPDNVHIRYGFPLTWGIHTVITLAGPVDLWEVNVINLTLDLILWLGLMTISPLLLQMWRNGRTIIDSK